jgi:hypothetical protein
MKAMVLREAGGLRVETLGDSVPGAGEVIARVRTTAFKHCFFITRACTPASASRSCWATMAWARWPRSGPVSKAYGPPTASSSSRRSIGEMIGALRDRGFASSVSR